MRQIRDEDGAFFGLASGAAVWERIGLLMQDIESPPALRFAEALSRVPATGEPFVRLFEHGTLVVGMYAPRDVDLQTPHARDEVYIVAAGTAEFFDGTGRRPVAAGDFLFVPAFAPHRFASMSEDFATWVMFYGPEGGEKAGK